eukprot:gene10147-4732_t
MMGAPRGGDTVWRFADGKLADASYKVGDMVCVKIKGNRHLGHSCHFQNGDGVSFTRVRWTQHSRGCIRGGISNIRFAGCVVERPPPLAGITPCLATAGGGPQIGCTTDEEHAAYNVTVINHTSDATGDDSLAFFNVQSGL